ncbi:MAG: hypothetical protein WC761_01995 [Candidatus Paceibacterota bacterium]|jgi:hypothetical protein
MRDYNDNEEFYRDDNAYGVDDRKASYSRAVQHHNELAEQRRLAAQRKLADQKSSAEDNQHAIWSGINASRQNDKQMPEAYSATLATYLNSGVLQGLSGHRFKHKEFPSHEVDIYYDVKTRDLICFSDRYRDVHIQGTWYRAVPFSSLSGYLANRAEKGFSVQQKIPPAVHTPTKITKSPTSSKKKTSKKEDTKMDYDRTPSARKTSKASTMKAVKDALVHGSKVAVADEASNVMLSAAKLLLGDAYPVLMSTPDGQEVAKGLTAIALMYATDVLPGVIPQEDAVRTASTLVLEAVSRDLVQPRLAALQPVLMQLAAAGAKVLTPTEK